MTYRRIQALVDTVEEPRLRWTGLDGLANHKASNVRDA